MVTGVAHAAAVARQLPDLPEREHPGRAVAAGLLRRHRPGRARSSRRASPDAIMGSFAADHLVADDPASSRRYVRERSPAPARAADDGRHHPDPPGDRVRISASAARPARARSGGSRSSRRSRRARWRRRTVAPAGTCGTPACSSGGSTSSSRELRRPAAGAARRPDPDRGRVGHAGPGRRARRGVAGAATDLGRLRGHGRRGRGRSGRNRPRRLRLERRRRLQHPR